MYCLGSIGIVILLIISHKVRIQKERGTDFTTLKALENARHQNKV